MIYRIKNNIRKRAICNKMIGESGNIRDSKPKTLKTASLVNDRGDILPQGGHATFPAAVKPCRLISFIPRVVSTNYELAPAIIKKCNFAARTPRSSLNALTISYPVFPEVYMAEV